jgi:polyvinyl alcohol dehydrogenase (cytochrome)
MPLVCHARSLAPALLAAAALAVTAAASAQSETQSLGEISCSDRPGPVALGSAQWNGWGRDIENTRYQPEPAIRATDVSKLALKWAFGYPGSSASGQPAIVDGRVFVAGTTGRVYSLDAKTGCTYWTYDAQAAVRTAISIAELAAPRLPKPKKSKRGRTNAHLDVQKAPSAAFFGDDKGAVYALDAQSGALLWKTQVDAHPMARIQASPTVYHDRVYVAVASSEPDAAQEPGYACCTFRGSVAALDIATGRLVWRSYTVTDAPRAYRTSDAGVQLFGPAGAQIKGAPAIDAARGVVYVATGAPVNATEAPLSDAVVAFDLIDGKVRWAKHLGQGGGEADAFDSPPILRALASGKQVILAGQRSGVLFSLDPDRAGEILWQTRVSEFKVTGGIDGGAAADHRSLYVALSGLTATPADSSGDLVAIDMKTGARRWQTAAPTPSCSWGGGEHECPHAQAQAVTVIPGVAFSGSMDGHLRAYSTIDGKILWDCDTAKEYITVNRIKASGGSLDEGGATIVNGVVFVNSGGGRRTGRPGNVLLAFSVDGK